MANESDLKRAREQAAAQYQSIFEMITRLREADEAGDDDKADEIREQIQNDALSVQIRDGWRSPGSESDGAEEYELLLCTGGPAVRIIGGVDRGSPTSAEIQFQDWFTPWTEWRGSDLPDSYDESVLIEFASCFYLGE